MNVPSCLLKEGVVVSEDLIIDYHFLGIFGMIAGFVGIRMVVPGGGEVVCSDF